VRIGAATLFELTLPLKSAFETSSHSKREIVHIIVRLTAENGDVGYGEVCCETAPYFGPETVTSCWHVLESFLVPALLELEFEHPREVAAELARFRGNHFAKAGLDMAAWDLYARSRGEALAAALGATRSEVASGVSLGIRPDPDETVQEAVRAARAGHARVKLKVRPGMARDVVDRVGAALDGFATQLAVDANGSFTEDGMDELAALDGRGVALIEQPFGAEEWLLHRELAAGIETPVCLDESITGLGSTRLALEIGACDMVNIKVSRVGGLTAAVAIHDLCLDAGVPVWCGGMHEFGIGRSANVALAALPGFTEPGDISGSDERYELDIVDPSIVACDGRIAVPTGPGIGHMVSESRLGEMTRRSMVLDGAALVAPATAIEGE
jgi:O-succinylbenzoate synthase